MEDRKKYIIILLTISCIVVVGFAVLSTSISLDGTSTINANTWNVKFQNIVEDTENNVNATTTPTISDNTNVSFAVTLSKPGDKYSFTVDVVNTGSIDAMIDTISKSSLTTEQAKLLDYTVTYSDGLNISQKDKLVKTSGSETIKVSVNYKTDVVAEDLPSSEIDLTLDVSLNYIQADDTANVVGHSLDDFITLAKAGNATSNYVGKEFTVSLGSTYGEHTLRVANVSTPSECSGSDFSQTACGVVLEFADIITNNKMNSSNTNVGGWPSCSMRTFVNNDIYNSLPTNLKNAIIYTKVVSGHGSTTGETNFTSTDILYLLSPHEVWSDLISNDYNCESVDSSWNNTRQLDYYAKEKVSSSSYDSVKKKYNDSYYFWWFRTPSSTSNNIYLRVWTTGRFDFTIATLNNTGVSPAFRIA